jgi:hypothetical protein
MSRTMTVVQDYLAMGVKQVWIFDPWKKKAYICDSDGLRLVTEQQIGFRAQQRTISLSLHDIFLGQK